MKIHGTHYRTIWLAADGQSVEIIDQTKLPHVFEIVTTDVDVKKDRVAVSILFTNQVIKLFPDGRQGLGEPLLKIDRIDGDIESGHAGIRQLIDYFCP